jgi:hypothetical protein
LLGFGSAKFVVFFFIPVLFAAAGWKLTRKLQFLSMGAILRQDLAFFEKQVRTCLGTPYRA